MSRTKKRRPEGLLLERRYQMNCSLRKDLMVGFYSPYSHLSLHIFHTRQLEAEHWIATPMLLKFPYGVQREESLSPSFHRTSAFSY